MIRTSWGRFAIFVLLTVVGAACLAFAFKTGSVWCLSTGFLFLLAAWVPADLRRRREELERLGKDRDE